MLEIQIENLTFPKEDVERIEIHRDGRILIHLSDTTLNKKTEYQTWRNHCGMLEDSEIAQLSIGQHHFAKKFHFTHRVSKGTPGVTADNIFIDLSIQK